MARADETLAGSLLGPSQSEELALLLESLTNSRAAIVAAADAERRRIERDLHDGAQQRLVSLAMNLGMARARLTDVPEPELRAIADAHDEALMAFAARAPRPVRLSVDAQATQAEVTVARDGDLLRIAVTDNGTGGPTVIAAELPCAS